MFHVVKDMYMHVYHMCPHVQVESLNDRKEFDQVRVSMRVIGFTNEEVSTIWKLLATILHLVRDDVGMWND